MTVPEFSRPQRLDQIGAGESHVDISAEPAERNALVQRFRLVALDRLEARFTLRREGQGVLARGRLWGEVAQACVATQEPVPARIEEEFAIRFVPEREEGIDNDELELSEDACDTVFYSGGVIDLGEAAAETLALALDPFPRSPNAEAALREAGVLSEEEAIRLAQESGPFGGLAALRDKLAPE